MFCVTLACYLYNRLSNKWYHLPPVPSQNSIYSTGGRKETRVRNYLQGRDPVPSTRLILIATLGDRKILLQRSQGNEFNDLLKVIQLFGGRAQIQIHVHITEQVPLFIGPRQFRMGQNPDLLNGKKKSAFHTYRGQSFPFAPPALPCRGQLWGWKEGVLFKGRICLTICTQKDHTGRSPFQIFSLI